MTDQLPSEAERLELAISAAADALLSICSIQTGPDPLKAGARALDAIEFVFAQAAREAGA